jgi:hypothetical protein
MLELDPDDEPELVRHYSALNHAGDGPTVIGPDGDPLGA